MTKKLGVAFIGTGNIALMHAFGYKDFPDAEIRALCDLNPKRAERFREEAGLSKNIKIFKSSAECLKNENIDLVEILTPHAAHEAIAIEAAEAGKHISLQKPPTLTLSSYDKILSATKKAGVKFRVFENFRYHPPYVKAKKLIEEGVIGIIESVNIRMWMSINGIGEYRGQKRGFPLHTLKWKIKDEQNYKAPVLFDDGYHKHSIVQYFLGDISRNSIPITAVRAWSAWDKLYKIVKLDSPSVVIYETDKKNTYGTWNVNMSKYIPLPSNYFTGDEMVEITGSKGIIMALGCTGDLFAGCDCGGPGNPGVYWYSSDVEIEPPFKTTGTWKSDCSMDTDWKYSFINCTRHYASILARDEWFDEKDPRPIKAEQGRHIQAINIGIVRSLRKDGAKVYIKDIDDKP